MGKRSSKESWRKKRSQDTLPEKRYYYIFTEGTKTEPSYFNGFKKYIESNPIYKNMVQVDIKGLGRNTTAIVKNAQKYIDNNSIESGEIWCVYDKDDFPADRFDGVLEQVSKLNSVKSDVHYHAAWSNECIEYWFVLHFSYYHSNNNRTQYIENLSSEFKKRGLKEYKKNMDDIFEVLLAYGNPKSAAKRAGKRLQENSGKRPSEIAPGTLVHELVMELAEYLPEEIRNKFPLRETKID